MAEQPSDVIAALIAYRVFGLECAELGPGKHDFVAVVDLAPALAGLVREDETLTPEEAKVMVYPTPSIPNDEWTRLRDSAWAKLRRLAGGST